MNRLVDVKGDQTSLLRIGWTPISDLLMIGPEEKSKMSAGGSLDRSWIMAIMNLLGSLAILFSVVFFFIRAQNVRQLSQSGLPSDVTTPFLPFIATSVK